jgi:hypothetical protein
MQFVACWLGGTCEEIAWGWCLGMGVKPLSKDDGPLAHGTRGAFLIGGEVMKMVHDSAVQMVEHEPEHCSENFLGCRRHAGRVSQVGMGSRIILDESLGVPS